MFTLKTGPVMRDTSQQCSLVRRYFSPWDTLMQFYPLRRPLAVSPFETSSCSFSLWDNHVLFPPKRETQMSKWSSSTSSFESLSPHLTVWQFFSYPITSYAISIPNSFIPFFHFRNNTKENGLARVWWHDAIFSFDCPVFSGILQNDV